MVKTYRGGRRMVRRRPARKAGSRPTVSKLAREVRKIKRSAVNTVWNQLTGTYNANLQSDYMYYPLDKFSSLVPRFGMALADGDQNVVTNYSDLLRLNIDLDNGILSETATVNIHVFLVTLKDEIGQGFNPSTGDITLSSGTHYYTAGQGLYVLNPRVFKIHAQKRFKLTNHGIATTTATGQSQYGTNMSFDMYLKRKQIVRTLGADWIATPCPADPSKNAFVLIFNDNSALDAEYPALNILHKKTVRC